ncbi:hypothetical protein KY290_029731 [Solanum tuberosum]|uniref:Uncharacterized protein n=1 Tax=Solanum tuberosum TaxID=4113 RepID=A0ABQ7ULW4_SOLTU|nr:hypothetical protein KY289_029058 [Solanum tuberosum]KAH0667661.1 hypothetical protein KY285_028867 [Solanum tuberosum]KAH0750499.1 hypothetical protein KY290_029731 [Solanum tuberosum]
MATEPQGTELRPSDQSQSTRISNINKPQQGASPESSTNSTKLRRIKAIYVAILEEELDWDRKIMSLEQSGMIRVNSTGNNESTSKDLPPVQKSMKAISEEITAKSPDVRLQFQPSSDERNEVTTTVESSPGQGVHLTEISNLFDCEISSDINSGKVTRALVDEEQVTAINEDHNNEENLESVRITSILNQENNQDKERIPNHRVEPLQHGHEKLSIKETTDENVLRKMQGDQNATAKHTQEAQHTNAKVQTGASKDKQHGNGGKSSWKVKDKINPNESAMQQSKKYGGNQPNSTTKEKAVAKMSMRKANFLCRLS